MQQQMNKIKPSMVAGMHRERLTEEEMKTWVEVGMCIACDEPVFIRENHGTVGEVSPEEVKALPQKYVKFISGDCINDLYTIMHATLALSLEDQAAIKKMNMEEAKKYKK